MSGSMLHADKAVLEMGGTPHKKAGQLTDRYCLLLMQVNLRIIFSLNPPTKYQPYFFQPFSHQFPAPWLSRRQL